MEDERRHWLDGMRGIALLLMLPAAARMALHPSGQAWRAQPDAGGWSWWLITETFSDETAVWLLAMCIGAGLALRRNRFEDERTWTAQHRARWLVLLAAALLHAYHIAPWSVLAATCAAALLISEAVRESTCRPCRTGIAIACIPVMITVGESILWERAVQGSGQPWATRLEMTNPTYDHWETASYQGDWQAQKTVRRRTWWNTTTRDLPRRDLWHIGAGILIGLWWQRAGRHRRRASRDGWRLMTAGLTLNVGSASLGWLEMDTGLTERTADLVNYAGGGFLAAGLLGTIGQTTNRLWQTAAGDILAAAGRHPLSLGAIGTLTLAAIAHGWGLGLHGQLNGSQSTAICIMFGATALALSAFRTEHERGPAETGWRNATGRLLKAAKDAE